MTDWRAVAAALYQALRYSTPAAAFAEDALMALRAYEEAEINERL